MIRRVEIVASRELIVGESARLEVRFMGIDKHLLENLSDRSEVAEDVHAGVDAVVILPHELVISVSSAGLEISPAAAITRPAGSPAIWAWTMTPKTLGNHVLVIDFTDFYRHGLFHEAPVIQQVERELESDTSRRLVERLPLSVRYITVNSVTPFGMDGWTFQVSKYVIIALGGFLSFPLVVEILRKRLSRPKEASRIIRP